MMPPEIQLTTTLRRHRTAAGLTQAQLAHRAGVSRKTINTIENSIYVPSTVLALRLAHTLSLPVEAIFTLAAPQESRDPAPNKQES